MLFFADDPGTEPQCADDLSVPDSPALVTPERKAPETPRKKKLKNEVKRLKAQVKRLREAKRKDCKLVRVESALAVLSTILPHSTMVFIRAQVRAAQKRRKAVDGHYLKRSWLFPFSSSVGKLIRC